MIEKMRSTCEASTAGRAEAVGEVVQFSSLDALSQVGNLVEVFLVLQGFRLAGSNDLIE